MSREIKIHKFEGNTQYSVHVIDSYGKEHHLGYYNLLYAKTMAEIEMKAEEIWKNEVEPKKDLLGDAIAECVQSDIDRGVEPSLD